MAARDIIKYLVFASLIILLLLSVNSTVEANDDFTLRISMNGNDISAADTIIIYPDRPLDVELQIYNVTSDVTLHSVTVLVTFAEQVVQTRSVNLGDYHIAAGDSYTRRITLDTGEELKIADRPLVTGIYRSQIKLEYSAGSQARALSQWKNIKIPGNPLTTPAGAAGVAVGAGTLVSILLLIRSLAVPSITAGTTLPLSAPVKALPRLYELAAGRLESLTRGRVAGTIVSAAKKRIIKDKCPICETRLKHGHCYTCKKSAKEVRKEYTDKMKDLVLKGSQLITSGEAATLGELCSKLGVSGKLGTDIIATMRHAKLVKVKGAARKVTGKAVMVGIGSGLSTIIWVTVGGFAVLNTATLAGILVAVIVIPLVITKSLQMKARRTIKRGASS